MAFPAPPHQGLKLYDIGKRISQEVDYRTVSERKYDDVDLSADVYGNLVVRRKIKFTRPEKWGNDEVLKINTEISEMIDCPERQPNKSLTGAAGVCFASNVVRRALNENAPPGQLKRWISLLLTKRRLRNSAGWKLGATLKGYARRFLAFRIGSPESCGCADCLNFAAARDRAYPSAALAIFDQLGIDSHKESEIWHTHRDESGLHHYGGFFHFIGAIESGRDVMVKMSGYGTYDFETIGEHFEWGLASDTALVPNSFAGAPVTQFEFAARIPWVVDAPESD